MQKDYTYIGCVLDRSGSMAINDKITEARNGFNNFLKKQKEKNGKKDITVTIFDDKIETFYIGDVYACHELGESEFFARGMTSLYDAIGTTIKSIGGDLANKKEEERPSKVIILVITDGLENNSTEYSRESLKSIIEEQKNKYSWEFIFMGAGEEDILSQAMDIGIAANHVLRYADNNVGTRAAYVALNLTVSDIESNNFSGYSQDSAEEYIRSKS